MGNLLFFHRELGSNDEDASFEERSERLLFFYTSTPYTQTITGNLYEEGKISSSHNASGEKELAVLHMLESLIEFSAKFCYEKVDNVLTEKEFWTFYECEKNIFICASVSLFDDDGKRENKISRKKIRLYLKELYEDFVFENGRMDSILCGYKSNSILTLNTNNMNNNNQIKIKVQNDNDEYETITTSKNDSDNNSNDNDDNFSDVKCTQMVGWEVINFVKKLRKVLKKLLLKEDSLLWDVNNKNKNKNNIENCLVAETVEIEKKRNGIENTDSLSLNDNNDIGKCENEISDDVGKSKDDDNINHVIIDNNNNNNNDNHVINNDNNDNDDNYNDDYVSYNEIDTSTTHTATQHTDTTELIHLQNEIKKTRNSLNQILNNYDSDFISSTNISDNNNNNKDNNYNNNNNYNSDIGSTIEIANNNQEDKLTTRTVLTKSCTYTIYLLKKKLQQFFKQSDLEIKNGNENENSVSNENFIRLKSDMMTNININLTKSERHKNEKYDEILSNGNYHQNNDINYSNYTYIENLYSSDFNKIDNNDDKGENGDNSNNNNNNSNGVNEIFKRQIFRFEDCDDARGILEQKKKSSSRTISSWNGSSTSLQKLLHYFK